ncbi:MAG: YtxH domain-containing protein [Saprospiraceae bacterium]|nr:YtxH domain-containing protein [Saprospiraceae bacterium]
MSILSDFRKLLFAKKAVAKSAVNKAVETGKEVGEEFVEKSGEFIEKASDRAGELYDQASEKASELYEKAKNKVDDFTDKFWNAAEKDEQKARFPLKPIQKSNPQLTAIAF